MEKDSPRYKYRGDVIGWGPFKQDWYTISSRLSRNTPAADRLYRTGSYHYRWSTKVDSFVYRHNYRLWHWWANRPNGRTKKDLERWFPNLRR